MRRARVEAFSDLRCGLLWKVFGKQGQQGAPQQSEISQEIGVATPGAVFTHHCIAPPVVADFHSAPVTANQLQPLSVGILGGERTGKVIARLGGGEAGLLKGALTPQHHQRAGVRKIHCQRFDGEGIEAAGFRAAMSGGGVDKKGVAGKASRPCAV